MDGRLVLGFPAGGDPLALADATLYPADAARLPAGARRLSRRARRRDAAILPRIVPLGDIDEDEIAFAEAASGETPGALDLPEALGGLERRLLLAQLDPANGRDAGACAPAGEPPLVAQHARPRRWRLPTISRA